MLFEIILVGVLFAVGVIAMSHKDNPMFDSTSIGKIILNRYE